MLHFICMFWVSRQQIQCTFWDYYGFNADQGNSISLNTHTSTKCMHVCMCVCVFCVPMHMCYIVTGWKQILETENTFYLSCFIPHDGAQCKNRLKISLKCHKNMHFHEQVLDIKTAP